VTVQYVQVNFRLSCTVECTVITTLLSLTDSVGLEDCWLAFGLVFVGRMSSTLVFLGTSSPYMAVCKIGTSLLISKLRFFPGFLLQLVEVLLVRSSLCRWCWEVGQE